MALLHSQDSQLSCNNISDLDTPNSPKDRLFLLFSAVYITARQIHKAGRKQFSSKRKFWEERVWKSNKEKKAEKKRDCISIGAEVANLSQANCLICKLFWVNINLI